MRKLIAFLRSLAFNFCYHSISLLTIIALLPLLFLPGRKLLQRLINLWGRTVVFLMRTLAGIKLEIRGREHMPAHGRALIAAKHQSWSDGIIMVSLIGDLATVAMKDLLDYPLVGRFFTKMEMIMVDTCGGGEERRVLSEGAEAASSAGRPILIYPEGQLVPVGERARYKSGIWHMSNDLNLPVTPVATNIGLRWPLRAWMKYQGSAAIEFLPAIPAGLPKDEFLTLLESRIENATAQLVEEHA